MDATELCHSGAAEQARLIRGGEVSAVELMQATLDRIETIDPQINSFRCVFAEAALDAARVADANGNDPTKPMLGVPVAVKDNIAVEGAVTTSGSDGFETPAAQDAPIVASLRAAGAIVVGKTTCSELTVWPFTENETWGATRNPWNTGYSPGGSSGGSGAAVAAGLCGVAIGSDGLGSIRVPAGFNGVFGLKPHYGRVWHGPSDWKGMAVNGPLGRTVADAALFLDATSTNDTSATDDTANFMAALDAPNKALRIALAWKPLADYPITARLGDAERAAVERTADVLRGLGHDVVERKLSFSSSASSNGMIRYLAGIDEGFQQVEFPDRITKRTRAMAGFGRRIPARVVDWARRDAIKIASKLNEVFDEFDVVLTPGAVEAPLRIGELDGKGAVTTLRLSGKRIPHTGIWNVIGQPAASVPAGFSSIGLPVSVQLGGRPHDERTLLQLARQLETAQPWADKRPL